MASATNVANLCIQGYEPLLPDSFPYTRAILSTGQWLSIPTSFVTNGTHLAQWVDELAVLAPGRISVSLDAAEAEAHDRQRRKAGAFASTVEGLRRAASALPEETELVVTSVLIPKRRAQLDGVPVLLHDIGIKRWVVTALQKVGKDRPGGPVGEREKILTDLRILRDHAEAAGIDFKVDDEFDGLASGGKPDGFEKNRIRRLVNPDGVYRLVPDGRCSKGADILKPLTDQTPRWDPKTMDAATFLAQL
jgi:MoaA/NifB/PqqE/SkfB family radical SAM enzyme